MHYIPYLTFIFNSITFLYRWKHNLSNPKLQSRAQHLHFFNICRYRGEIYTTHMSSYWITKRTKINKKRPRLVHIALIIIKSSRILLNFVAFENRSLVLLLLCYCTISLCLSLSLKCQCHKNLNIFSKIHDLNIQWDEMWAKNKNSLISNETFWENFPHFFAAIELQILSFQSILGIAPTSLFYIIFVLSKTVNMRGFELRISGVKKTALPTEPHPNFL